MLALFVIELRKPAQLAPNHQQRLARKEPSMVAPSIHRGEKLREQREQHSRHVGLMLGIYSMGVPIKEMDSHTSAQIVLQYPKSELKGSRHLIRGRFG